MAYDDFAIQFIYVCDKDPHALKCDIFKYIPTRNMLGQMRGVQAMLDFVNDDIISQTMEILGKDVVKNTCQVKGCLTGLPIAVE